MDAKLLKAAHEKIPSVPVLVNPSTLLTEDDIKKSRSALDVDKCDIALAEVAQGKLIAEIDFDAIAKAEDAKTKWNQKHFNVNALFAD